LPAECDGFLFAEKIPPVFGQGRGSGHDVIDGGRVGFEKTEDRLLMASGGKELEEICSIYSCKNG